MILTNHLSDTAVDYLWIITISTLRWWDTETIDGIYHFPLFCGNITISDSADCKIPKTIQKHFDNETLESKLSSNGFDSRVNMCFKSVHRSIFHSFAMYK